MSSTLFGRGTNTQVGGKKRAEEQERAVLAVRAAVEDVRANAAPASEVRLLTARVAALEAAAATLQKTVATLSATVAATAAAAPATVTVPT